MIAPVRVGETLNNIFFEARAVSDPILSPIIGWKKEYHFFYVKITDLMIDAIRDMFVDPANTDLAATYGIAANSQPYYTAKGGIDYLYRCVKRVVETYFRDQDEAAATWVNADGTFRVQHRESSFLDSITDKDDMPEGAAISGATDAGDLERLMNAFEMLRAMGLANMSYEDWLRSQGIAIPNKDENKPEHIAYFSDFTYPSNTIDPSSGAPSSAVSWVFKNSMRDPKFFKEPGFLIGISITRPKIYMGGLAGNAAAHLSRMWDWVTNIAQMVGPETRLKQFAQAAGPLGDRTTDPDSYWLDMADLFSYGDQFQNVNAFNVVPAVIGAAHSFPVPLGSMTDVAKWKYLAEADLKQLFKTPATDFYVRSDGFASLSIKGDLTDITVAQIAQS